MKTKPDSPLALKDIPPYALAYLLWLVTIAVCVVTVIQFRSTVNVLWVALGGNRYSLGLANQVSLLLGGFIAFIYVMFLESYYRESIVRQVPSADSAASTPAPASPQRGISQRLAELGLDVLLRRFAITIAIPLGVLAASFLALEIALRTLH